MPNRHFHVKYGGSLFFDIMQARRQYLPIYHHNDIHGGGSFWCMRPGSIKDQPLLVRAAVKFGLHNRDFLIPQIRGFDHQLIFTPNDHMNA